MILRNCRLIPELCEGFEEERADIRVENDAIAEILPAGGQYVGEIIVECEGKTVLPGLFNLHTHLFNDYELFLNGHPEEWNLLAASIQYMQLLLTYGFTSIRDVGSACNIPIKLRDRINAGKMIGPDIKASGAILTPDFVVPAWLNPYYSSTFAGRPINNPWQARGEARRQIAEGADFIKTLGSSVVPGKRGGGPLLYPDELAELVQVVKNEGTYLAVHSVGPEANAALIDAEVYSIEHAMELSQENLDQILAHNCKSNIVATLSICGEDSEIIRLCQSLRMAHDAGVLIGFGTDVSRSVFAEAPEAEFTARSRVWGISNVEILKQATINSAKINGTADLRGSIKIGKRADFAIFNGNPDEDLSLLGIPCAYVLKDGVVVAQNGMIRAQA